MEHKSDGHTNSNWSASNGPQGFGKELEELEIGRRIVVLRILIIKISRPKQCSLEMLPRNHYLVLN